MSSAAAPTFRIFRKAKKMIEIELKRIHPEARLPRSMNRGLSLHAHLLTERDVPSKSMIPPRTIKNIPTGWMYMGKSYIQIITPGWLTVSRALFVIDTDATDVMNELVVPLYNGGHEAQWIHHGESVGIIMIRPTEPLVSKVVFS